MGQQNIPIHFSQEDFKAFNKRLYAQVDQMRHVIRQPDFGTDPLKIGAELEIYLTDENFQVSPCNLALLEELKDDQFQPELNRYNVELNLSAVDVVGRPFTSMLNEMRRKMDKLEACAMKKNINIIPVGILPTITKEDFGKDFMTDVPRYRALSSQLAKVRGEAFKVNIQGEEPVALQFDDVTLEGANTSFQVHLMVEHKKFADIFNAAQLSLPLVIAACANSGVFMGNLAWDETRVALFKQSLDTRIPEEVQWQQPTRVSFGHGWIRKDAWEIFAEAVALFPPILPTLFDDPAQKGHLPGFKELRLHLGTTWPWNRPVYSREGTGHIRIEFRALPAGPSAIDMAANAAFSIGLATGLAERIEDYLAVMPFKYAEYNFYRAAKDGLDAKILWPFENDHYLVETPLIDVLKRLLPHAHNGLKKLGVDQSEINLYLGIIHDRIEAGITGARWKKNSLKYLEQDYEKAEATRKMTKLYLENSRSGRPVSEWKKIWL